MIEPLNLEYLLINTFAGSPEIFILVSFIVIAMISAKFKMSNITFGIIAALFCVMMASVAQWILLLAGLMGGFIIFFAMGRLVK